MNLVIMNIVMLILMKLQYPQKLNLWEECIVMKKKMKIN